MEIWKDIKGFEGSYQVSNLGRIRSCNRVVNNSASRTGKQHRKGKILALNKTYRGYYIVHLFRGGKKIHPLVHRLVAQAFIPNPENKPQINHIDGNPRNNQVKNLEWATESENMRHACYVLKKNIRPVKSVETGQRFPSVRAAERVLGVAHGVISTSIKLGCRVKGEHWRYDD